jgi:hypothetical protein
MELPIPGLKMKVFRITSPTCKLCRQEPQKALPYARPRCLSHNAGKSAELSGL